VAVNVASLSISLAESELFGHERGAFTGADAQRAGLLAQADGGTLFLDEVADIPLPVQVKLLRALDHGEVTPVGANHAVPTRFRVISATHQDLLQAIGDGSFRHDLYFRLCAFQIAIPPLRNRQDDIVELARHFLSLSGRHSPSALPEQTVRELRQRRWSGNVRELRNAMEHAVIVSRGGRILPEHLPAPLTAPWLDSADSDSHIDGRVIEIIRQWAESRFPEDLSEGRLYEELLRLVEPPLLRTAMQRHQGQCNTAARSLGLHRTTLRKKLDDYGIE
jgi:two-component system nitrogen regulation response regulator GlnG